MAYNFFINKGATLPTLRMEAINDGRHDFSKLNIALQAADVYFNMTNIENGIRKIANQKANVIMKEDDVNINGKKEIQKRQDFIKESLELYSMILLK